MIIVRKIVAIALSLMLISTGCVKDKAVDQVKVDNGGLKVPIEQSKDDERVRKYDVVGEILQFEDGKVHILTGDIANSYEINNEELEKLYLGQKVGLTQQNDNTYTIKPVLTKNFDIYHTNMGLTIHEFKGEVFKVSKDMIMIGNKEDRIMFNIYRDPEVTIGEMVTVEYVIYGEDKNVIQIYNEASRLDLIVKKINRMDNGAMKLNMKDEKGMEYIVSVSGRVKFNYSELAIGDELIVYPEIIMESYPMQVTVKKIERK